MHAHIVQSTHAGMLRIPNLGGSGGMRMPPPKKSLLAMPRLPLLDALLLESSLFKVNFLDSSMLTQE